MSGSAAFDEKYVLEQIEIGSGATAVVMVCRSKADGSEYAVKIVDRKENVCDEEQLRQEVAIMQSLDHHPNIIQLVDFYETPDAFLLVIELAEGGELFEKILENRIFTEDHARKIACQLFEALRYMHSRGVAHRDLKPENIMFKSDDIESPVKIVDFGFAKQFRSAASPSSLSVRKLSSSSSSSSSQARGPSRPRRVSRHSRSQVSNTPSPEAVQAAAAAALATQRESNNNLKKEGSVETLMVNQDSSSLTLSSPTPKTRHQRMCTMLGTQGYAAPEVFEEGSSYSETCDVWSIGIIVYILLSGMPPFVPVEEEEEDEEEDEEEENESKEEEEEEEADLNDSNQQKAVAALVSRFESRSTSVESSIPKKKNNKNKEEEKKKKKATETKKVEDEKEAVEDLPEMEIPTGPPFWVYVNQMQQDREKLKLRFPEKMWKHVSMQAREFLKEVLTPDPLTRPSASKLLEHRWVAMNGRRSSSRSNGIQEDYPDNKHGGETPIPSGNNDDTGKRNQGTAAIGGSRDAAAADPSSSAAGTCQENNGRNENEGCSTAGCADGGGENGKGPTQGHRASHSSSASSRHVRQYSRSTGDIFGGGARNDGSHHHHRSSSKRGSRVVPINNLSHRRRLMTMLGSYPMKRATFGASRLEIRNAHSLQRRIVGIAKPSPRNGGRASLQGSGTAHVNGSEEWRTLESSDDEARPLSFGEKYELKNLQLGMGSSSIAMLCRNKETRSDHAVCILDRARVECSRQAMLRFRKLKSLEHDQLLKTADTFITPERLLIVSEMCWGGDLFEHMVRHRQVAEPEARNIIKAVLSAVAYLHTNGVVHGNVTPEKILLSSPNDVSSLRLDPFSMSAHITLHDPRNDIGDEKKQQHRMATTTTPLSSPPLPAPQAAHAATSPSHWYMAPELSSSRKGQHKAHREEEKEKAGGNEVGPSSQQQSEKEHKGNEGKGNGKTTTTTKSGSNTATSTTTTTTLNTYGSEKADMWSVGVLAYTLIAGVPPFTVSSSTPPSSSQFPFWVHIPDMVQDGSRQLDFGGKAWEHVSSEAIAFVRTALQFEPEKRFEASEALKHPWMTTVLSIPSVNEKSEGAAGNDIKLNDGNASEDTSSVRDMRRGSVLTSKRHSLAVEPGSPTGSVHSSTSNQSSLSRPKKREMMRWKMVQRARWRRRQRLPTSVWKTLMNPVESSRDDAAPLPKSAAKWLQHMQEVGGRMSSSPTSKPQVGSSSRDGVTGNRPDNGVSAAAPLSPSAAPSSSRPDSRRSRAIYSHTRKRSKSRSLVSEMRLWTEEEVGEWVARRGASKKWAGYADVCFSEGFDGVSLLHAKKESLIKMGIRHHHADAIIGERDVYLSTSSSSVLHAAAGGGHTKGRAVPSSSRVNTHHQHSASPHHQNQLLSQSQLQEQGDQKAVPPYHPFSRDSRDGGGNQHTSSLARGSPSISPLSKAHSPHHQGVSSSSRNASSRSKSPRHDRHNREGSGGGSGSVPLLVALLWKRQKLGWGTRVFKLTSSALKYYRPAANERYAKAELLGTFELGYISRVYAEEDSNLIFRIDIASAGGKRLRLRAATPLQREDWIRTLNDARSKVARKKPKVGKFWKAQPTVVMVTPPADNDEDTV